MQVRVYLCVIVLESTSVHLRPKVHAGGRDHLKMFMFLCVWACVSVYFGGNEFVSPHLFCCVGLLLFFYFFVYGNVCICVLFC
jgi:hypothetical protein